MSGPGAADRAAQDASRDAIAQVLQAEREAAQSIELARLEGERMTEDARSSARRIEERTEQRIRAVHEAFERELARQLLTLDTEAAALAQAHAPGAEELHALAQAVRALAQELTGVPA
ncbi:MAG: hypothetical protein Q8R72_16910 [Hylemonella sp.]|nr:hypothetical protein [Hylemonella sp.]